MPKTFFLTLLASAAFAVPTAHAAAPACDAFSLHAAGTDSSGIHDTAVTSWRCTDTSLATHSARLVWQWWYYTDDLVFGTIPGCPTSAAPAVTQPWAGATVVAGTATCAQPAGSPGSGEHRIVCADLLVDGAPTFGTSPFTNGACVEVTKA
jgi:hypothetical protein